MRGGSELCLARQIVRNDRGYALLTMGVRDRVVQPIVAVPSLTTAARSISLAEMAAI
jgi:hypothetical protein